MVVQIGAAKIKMNHAANILEHYELLAEKKHKEGKLEGKIESVQVLYEQGFIDEFFYQAATADLRRELAEIRNQSANA